MIFQRKRRKQRIRGRESVFASMSGRCLCSKPPRLEGQVGWYPAPFFGGSKSPKKNGDELARLRFLRLGSPGRLLALALRESFVVPLPLSARAPKPENQRGGLRAGGYPVGSGVGGGGVTCLGVGLGAWRSSLGSETDPSSLAFGCLVCHNQWVLIQGYQA